LKDPPDGGRWIAADSTAERDVKSEPSFDVRFVDVDERLTGEILGGQPTPRFTFEMFRLGAQRQSRVEVGLGQVIA
jgi:hypothetical protein